jgi:nucleoside-diphosphate-sugar epimerase
VQADLTVASTLKDLPDCIDTLVFMPTPARRDEASYETIYLKGWQRLWQALPREPGRSLLVSSTAVFGQSDGALVDEDTGPAPQGFNGRVLMAMEEQGRACTKRLVTVRFSGIYGPGRGRLAKLATRKGLEVQLSPPFFTNRIHRDDAAGALSHLLQMGEPLPLYLVSDDLPAPRYDVMRWLARAQGAPDPVGVQNRSAGRGKQISNSRLRKSGFRLEYPDYRRGYGAVLGLENGREN